MKYQVVYADPPWDIKKIQRKVRPNQVDMDYPTMTIQEIKNLGIDLRPFLADNCTLWLWTIQSYLPLAFSVMGEWGFKYQRTITWDKQNGLCLFGFHNRTEFLLFGYRGKLEMYPRRKAFPTIVQEKSPRHSEKPQVFRDLIMPFGEPRLELFAREKVDGWDCWGNEVESDIELIKSSPHSHHLHPEPLGHIIPDLTGSYNYNTDITPEYWRVYCPSCNSDNVCCLHPDYSGYGRRWFCISCNSSWEYVSDDADHQ